MKRIPFIWGSLGLLLSFAATHSEVIELEPYQVVADQWFPQNDRSEAYKSEWNSQDITVASPLSIDEVLYQDPSFSFYRRQDGMFANPSTQGVSLRNIGATAAGRSLVLVDGVPANDAFGGWMYWSQIDPYSIESVRLLPSHIAGSWGDMSAGGVISIHTKKGNATNSFNLTFGEASTLASSVSFSHSSENLEIRIHGNTLDSNGDEVVHNEDRGPIDIKTDRLHHVSGVSATVRVNEDWQISTTFSHFEEKRGNGTKLARNEAVANDFYLKLEQLKPNSGQSWLFYSQQREYQNTFTSVNSDRTEETLVNQQFSIPSASLGLKWSGFNQFDSGVRTMAGASFRRIDGETNENVGWGLKTRRKAGGEQQFTGAFLLVDYEGWDKLIAGSSVRFDHWSIREGKRIESSNLTDETTRYEIYEDRNSNELSYSTYFRWKANQSLDVHLSVSQSFRLPTINELYRPFRVRNDITESNALLKTEQFQNVDLSVKWSSLKHGFSVGVFHYRINDAIANVYQFDGPAQSLGGFVPEGGTFNQKQNVEESSVTGVRMEGWSQINHRFSAGFNYLYSNSEFGISKHFPVVSGKSFPQVPEHKLVSRLICQATDKITLEWLWTWSSKQFDDPGNTRILDSYHRHDFLARWKLFPDKLLVLRIKNLSDETILTGKSSNGIRSVAPGRFASFSFNWQF